MRAIKAISIGILTFISCSFIKDLGKDQTSAYFYFELIPVKRGMPYYFSQTIGIKYNDGPDLKRQLRRYVHELQVEVVQDGRDSLLYHQYVSPRSDIHNLCEDVRLQAIKALNIDNKSIIEKKIHE